VAREAGVSISTVSRILNNTARVAPEKEEAVRRAISRLQYEPNQFGRGLVTQKTNLIGIYLGREEAPLDSAYNLELVKGAGDILVKAGFGLVLLTDTQQDMPVFYQYIREKRIDGLILSGLTAQLRRDAAFQTLLAEGYPVSYAGKRMHSVGNNVYASYIPYHLAMLEKLRARGHRRILMLFSPMECAYREELSLLAAEQMPDIRLYQEPVEPGTGMLRENLSRWIREECCTAVCSPSVESAQRILVACAELKLRVPGDISLVTVEHTEGDGALCIPPVSAWYVPARQMGREAARQVLSAVNGGKEPRYCEFRAVFYDRESVGPAPDLAVPII